MIPIEELEVGKVYQYDTGAVIKIKGIKYNSRNPLLAEFFINVERYAGIYIGVDSRHSENGIIRELKHEMQSDINFIIMQ